MRRIRALLIPAGLVASMTLFSLAAFTAVDGTFTVFGPQNFQRSAGRPASETRTFSVGPGGSNYRLRVFNGGESESYAHVNSAVVSLNGKQILGPSDFGSNVGVLERMVTLKASNTLVVELRSAPGSGLTILIDGQQTSAPVIHGVASPAPNRNGWNNSGVTVTFTCSDGLSGILFCSGPFDVSSDGALQSITGVAVNRAGLNASTTVIVSMDRTPPAIAPVVTPAPNGYGWNNTDVTVGFNCFDALSGVNACSSPVAMSGVSAQSAGQNFVGIATDNAGNSVTATAVVNVDKTAPSLTVSPLPSTTSSSSLDVSGTVSDALSGVASVACNNSPAVVTGNGFTCLVTLAEGPNTIQVVATDMAGNIANRQADVTLATFVAPPFGPVPVSWMTPVGVSASGNSLAKTDIVGGWNSGAVSSQVLRDGHGFVEFTASETNTSRMAGLGAIDSNQDFPDVDHGIMLRDNGTVGVFESGAYRGDFGSYAAADRFRIEVRYGVARYFRNGVTFFTSPVPVRSPLRVDTSLFTPGATLTDVRVGSLVLTFPTGVLISGESVVKTGAAGWNAGSVSTNTIESGDGYFEFTAVETNTLRMGGLGTMSTGIQVAEIQFGIRLNSDATLDVVEIGASRGSFGLYASGDRLRVEVAGGKARYYKNGLLLYTSLLTPAYPLRGRLAFNTPGATLQNADLEPMVWTDTQNVFVNGPWLLKTNGAGWTSATSSTNLLASDGYLEFTATETNRRRGAGLQSGSGALPDSIDFALMLNETGILEILEFGVSRGTFGAYQNGDRLRIEIQNGVVRYLSNSALLYTSLAVPSYPLHAEAVFYTEGSTLFDVATGDLVWTNVVGASVGGRTLLKASPSAAWDAGAVSTKVITGSGFMEFTASEVSTLRMAGLSNGDVDQNYTDIDFGILLRDNGTVSIYEAGVLKGNFGLYVGGDRFRVEVNAGVVRYRRNGIILFTSTSSPLMPLRADTALSSVNATIFNVVVR